MRHGIYVVYLLYCTRDLPADTATALAISIYIYLRPARLSGVASEFLSDKAQLGSFAGQKNQLCPLCHICYIYYILLADGYCMYIVMHLQYLQRSVYVFRCTSLLHVYVAFDAQFWLKLHIHNRYKRVMVILYCGAFDTIIVYILYSLHTVYELYTYVFMITTLHRSIIRPITRGPARSPECRTIWLQADPLNGFANIAFGV